MKNALAKASVGSFLLIERAISLNEGTSEKDGENVVQMLHKWKLYLHTIHRGRKRKRVFRA